MGFFYISFKLPQEYPALEIPQVEISFSKEEIEIDFSEVLENIQEEARKELGTPCVFSLVSVFKDWIESSAEALIPVQADQKDDSEASDDNENDDDDDESAKRKAEEEAAEDVFTGTPLTVELFLQWKRNFEDEMQRMEELSGNNDQSKKGLLTGRMMFERDVSLVQSDMVDGTGKNSRSFHDLT